MLNLQVLFGEVSSHQSGSRNTPQNPYINMSSGGIMSNFHTMCLAFSLNHAVVVTCLAFSTTLLGDFMGSFILGILNVCFAFSAFFFANFVVLGFGSRESLLFGLIGYTVTATAFFCGLIMINISTVLTWMIIAPCYIIGGIAAGVIWTAQGRLYRLHSHLYAQKSGIDIMRVHSQFASIFTIFFLGFETCLKVLASILYFSISHRAEYVIFFFYAILGWITVIMGYSMLDLEEDSGSSPSITNSNSLNNLSNSPLSVTSSNNINASPNKHQRIPLTISELCSHAGLAGNLLYQDMKLVLLAPYQVCFGFTSAMVTYYILGTVIADSKHLGPGYVGIFSAIIVLSGAITAIPIAKSSDLYGKNTILLVGNITLLVIGVLVLLFPNTTIAYWWFMVPFCIIFGIGRGIWENTNKAVIADFYSHHIQHCTAAYSVTAFFNGYAAAMGYFIFLYIPRHRMAETIVLAGVVSTLTSQYTFIVQIKQKQAGKDRQRAKLVARQKLKEHQRQLDHQAFTNYAKESDPSVLL